MAHGDETYGLSRDVKLVPRDQYELEYLGLIADKGSQYHQAVFAFTWKGSNPIAIACFINEKPSVFDPVKRFSYHFNTGWELVPKEGFCAFGIIEKTFQPMQATKIIIDMSELETDFMKPLPLKKANKAALLLSCSQGDLVSSEFPLPLVP